MYTYPAMNNRLTLQLYSLLALLFDLSYQQTLVAQDQHTHENGQEHEVCIHQIFQRADL